MEPDTKQSAETEPDYRVLYACWFPGQDAIAASIRGIAGLVWVASRPTKEFLLLFSPYFSLQKQRVTGEIRSAILVPFDLTILLNNNGLGNFGSKKVL